MISSVSGFVQHKQEQKALKRWEVCRTDKETWWKLVLHLCVLEEKTLENNVIPSLEISKQQFIASLEKHSLENKR